MKTYEWVEVQFQTSALDDGKWSASRLCRFTLRETGPGVHYIRGWVNPQSLDGRGGVKESLLRMHGIQTLQPNQQSEIYFYIYLNIWGTQESSG
jgi:hypothetical protein